MVNLLQILHITCKKDITSSLLSSYPHDGKRGKWSNWHTNNMWLPFHVSYTAFISSSYLSSNPHGDKRGKWSNWYTNNVWLPFHVS